jgi:DNA-binding PadR family transcriptional regulator
MQRAPTTGDYLLKLERDMVGGFLHLLILQHLARHQVLHGYGLIKAMEEGTGGRGLWKEGTIYPLLAAMEAEGLVRSRWGVGEEGPRRKYYELTGAGRQVLRLAKAQWADLRAMLDALLEGTA